MSSGGVLVGFLRVLVSLDRVLMGSFVVTLFVVLSGEVVVLGSFFMVRSGFVVCFVCH